MDEMNPTGMNQTSKKSSAPWIVVAVILIIIIALAWWWYGSGGEVYEEPLPQEPTGEISDEVPEEGLEDTTPVINQDIDSIDLGDLEAEFDQIDAELDNL